MTITAQDLDNLSDCEVEEMLKTGRNLPPGEESCAIFKLKVRALESVLVFNYRLTARKALRQADPKDAADLWLRMQQLCNKAFIVLSEMKEKFPDCGTPELCDLALDYQNAAEERYRENLQDAECSNLPIPPGLFLKKS